MEISMLFLDQGIRLAVLVCQRPKVRSIQSCHNHLLHCISYSNTQSNGTLTTDGNISHMIVNRI